MEMMEVQLITDGGPWCIHNMPCAVCRKHKAVYDMNERIFRPCWKCHSRGWRVSRRRNALARWWRACRNRNKETDQ